MTYDPPAIKRSARQQRLTKNLLARSERSVIGQDAPESLVGLTEWNRIIEEIQDSLTENSGNCLPAIGSKFVDIINKVPQLRNHAFVGIDPERGIPQLIPKSVLYNNCYILGATGAGKTSCGMVPLVEQLGSSFDGKGEPLGDLPPHPVVIFDLKEVPDTGLKAAADRLAQARGQGKHCLLYSPDEDFVSLRWDLLSSARQLRGVNKQVGFILNGFGLVYDPVYGEEYFANAMGTALTAVIQKDSIESLSYNRLVELVGEVVTSKKKRVSNKFKSDEVVVTSWRDARGLYDKIQRLRLLDKLATVSSTPPDDTLNLKKVIEEGQVLYVHLGSTFMPNESWDIGRMMVFSLLLELVEQIRAGTGEIGRRRRCFLFIDEFQRLGVKNIVQRFEDARALGLTFVLSHQTPKSLPKKDGDLFEIVFQNCAFRQAFSIEDLELLETLEKLSGLKSEFLRTESQTFGDSQSTTHTSSISHSNSVTNTYGTEGDSVGYQSGVTTGQSVANTSGNSHSKSFGSKEQKVARFDYEANRLANAYFPSSVIYVRDGGRGSLTPTEAIPRHVHGVFFGPEETRSLPELGFVLRPREQQRLEDRTTPKIAKPAAIPQKPTKKKAKGKSRHSEAMRKQIADAAKELSFEMPEDRTLLFFARSNGVDAETLIAKCNELGIDVSAGNETVLSAGDLNTLSNHFRKKT